MLKLTLEAFLIKQRDDLERDIAKARDVLARQERILEHFNEMLRTMSPEVRTAEVDANGVRIEAEPEKREPRGLIKRLVLDVLRHHPAGLDALTILSEINAKADREYERTSLSPQLSRLKADGYVELIGNIWRLKKIEAVDTNLSKELSTASNTPTTAKGREAGPGGGT